VRGQRSDGEENLAHKTPANMSGGAARPAVDVGDADAFIHSIKIGSRGMHPGKHAGLDALRSARSKLESKPLKSAMQPYKYHLKTTDFEAMFTQQCNDTPKGQCDMGNLENFFSSARVDELIKTATIRFLCFYFQTHRTLSARLVMVDRTQWPVKLGIPPSFILKYWDQMRQHEVRANEMVPCVFGPIDPGWLFRRVTARECVGLLRIKTSYIVKGLHAREDSEQQFDFLPAALVKNKDAKKDRDKLEQTVAYHTSSRDQPAFNAWGRWNSDGIPKACYVQYQTVDGDRHFWKHIVQGETSTEDTPFEVKMMPVHIAMFSSAPKNPETLPSKSEVTRQATANAQRCNVLGTQHLAASSALIGRQLPGFQPSQAELSMALYVPDPALARSDAAIVAQRRENAHDLPGGIDLHTSLTEFNRQVRRVCPDGIGAGGGGRRASNGGPSGPQDPP